MAVRPDAVPVWATNTNYAGGPKLGTATKVEPSVGYVADGFRPNSTHPAQIENHWRNKVGAWLDYLASVVDEDDEHTYPTPKTRAVWIPLSKALSASALHTYNGGTEAWTFGNSSGVLRFPLELPSGATILGVRADVDPATTQATQANRMYAQLRFRDYSAFPTIAAPTNSGLAYYPSGVAHTPASIALDVSASLFVVDRSAGAWYVDVGPTTGAPTGDVLYGVMVTFLDIGPRNA